jgi:hypothetical protein
VLLVLAVVLTPLEAFLPVSSRLVAPSLAVLSPVVALLSPLVLYLAFPAALLRPTSADPSIPLLSSPVSPL